MSGLDTVEGISELVRSQQTEITLLRQQLEMQRRQIEQLQVAVKVSAVSGARGAGSSRTADGRSETDMKINAVFDLFNLDSIEELSTLHDDHAKCRYIHRLPCFHYIWSELCSLSSQISTLVGESSTSSTRSSQVGLRSAASDARIGSFVPSLGADIGPTFDPTLRGGMIQRLTKGGALELAGVGVGDVVTAIGGVPTPDAFTVGTVARAAARGELPGQKDGLPVVLHVIPVGRNHALTLSVHLLVPHA